MPRKPSIHWGPILKQVFPVVLFVALGVAAFQFIRVRLGPLLAEAREARVIAGMVGQCRTFAGGEDMVAARKACQALLDREPGNQAVVPLFGDIEKKEKQQQLCAEAEALIAAVKWAESARS